MRHRLPRRPHLPPASRRGDRAPRGSPGSLRRHRPAHHRQGRRRAPAHGALAVTEGQRLRPRVRHRHRARHHHRGRPVPPARPLTTNSRRSQPMRSKPTILVALLLAAFLVNLDTTLVNVALPAMVRQLHATTTQLQWVVDSYNLVFAALLLTFGSLSDRFGRKGMLLTGLAVVGTASLVGGFTTSPAQLIAARSVMGLGAAMTFPATLSLISNVFTQRRERARAIGLWGAIAGVAIALGPIVGGWLLESFSWTSIFVAMAPVAAAAVALVAASVPTSKNPESARM